MGTWQNGQGFNQYVAKKCGSKWELGKMDMALIRMWQKCGSKLSKMDQDVAKIVGPNGNLAKWLGL